MIALQKFVERIEGDRRPLRSEIYSELGVVIEQQCELHPEFENFSEEEIRRMMNCFTCNLPDEAASIMISEDSNE